MTVVPPSTYDAAKYGLALVTIGLLVLAAFTPPRRPGGIPHREHVGFCAIGVLMTVNLFRGSGPQAGGSAYLYAGTLTAIFCVFAVRSFRARRAEAALEPASTPAATPVGGSA